MHRFYVFRLATVYICLMVLSSYACCAQDSTEGTDSTIVQSTTLRLPPHQWDERLHHFASVDLLKLIYFLHLFYQIELGDHFGAGGAVQFANTVAQGAVGVGIQPEITFSFDRDPFDGPYLGITGWMNIVNYRFIEYKTAYTGRELGRITEFALSFAPVIGLHIQGPFLGMITQYTVGSEFNLIPPTQDVVGVLSSIKGIVFYGSIRLGYRW